MPILRYQKKPVWLLLSLLLPLRLIQHFDPLPTDPPLLQRLHHRILLRALDQNLLHRILRTAPHQVSHARGARARLLQFIGQRLRADVEDLDAGQLGDGLVAGTRLERDLYLGGVARLGLDGFPRLVIPQDDPVRGAGLQYAVDEGVAGDAAFGDDFAVERGVAVENCVCEDRVEVD